MTTELRQKQFKIETLEADLRESQNKCSITERRCQSLIEDLKVKSDQMEVELRKGMD
jgi:hypothetical protein